MTFPFVFISSTLEIVSGEKKTFTANFAQSAENNADPVFIKSGIYILRHTYSTQNSEGKVEVRTSFKRRDCDTFLYNVSVVIVANRSQATQ